MKLSHYGKDHIQVSVGFKIFFSLRLYFWNHFNVFKKQMILIHFTLLWKYYIATTAILIIDFTSAI